MNIPESLLVQSEGKFYQIFINENELRCHICQSLGHNAAHCIEEETYIFSTVPANFYHSNEQIQTDPISETLKMPLSSTESTSSLIQPSHSESPPQNEIPEIKTSNLIDSSLKKTQKQTEET